MRSRNIKPGFFQNENLVELEPQTRLLFIGLWLMADREGRLEDRPKKIKMQVFPADSWDVDSMLEGLTGKNLILRYKVDSKRYICIPAWGKHQNPHVNERESTIPAPKQNSTNPADSLIPDSLIPDCGGARKRAPTNYTPSVALLDGLTEETGAVDWELADLLKEMKDHEFKSAKKDWDAVYRNWVRKAMKWRKNETHSRNPDDFATIHAGVRKAAGLK